MTYLSIQSRNSHSCGGASGANGGPQTMGPPPPRPQIPEFGPGRPWDPYLRIGGIGGSRSPLSISKNVVIGPILSQKTVWPMYALVYPECFPMKGWILWGGAVSSVPSTVKLQVVTGSVVGFNPSHQSTQYHLKECQEHPATSTGRYQAQVYENQMI